MTSELAREMEQAQADEKAAMLDAVRELALIAEAMRPLEARKVLLTGMVKQYMALNDLAVLADGETGVAARLQDRTSSPTYDLVNASEHDEGEVAIMRAAAAGMLRVDHQMLERFRKGNGATWADTLARYSMPGSVTTALLIEGAK